VEFIVGYYLWESWNR